MIPVNVLITSASRKVNLVQEFKRVTGLYNGKVIAVDVNPLSPALYFADGYEIVPRSDDTSFIPKIYEICEKHKINLIIPTRDEELPLFAQYRTEMKEKGILVLVSNLNSVYICQNKSKFYEFCVQNKLPVPHRYENVNEIVNYPVFVKPVVGKGGKNAYIVRTKSELNRILNNTSEEYVIEEYIPWQEYTIDLFSDFQGEIISVIPRKRSLVISGESYVTSTVKDDVITSYSCDLTRRIGLVGHITIQCFKNDGNELKFIEVNPRFGGAAHAGIKAGGDSPLFLMRLMQGEKLKPIIGKHRKNLTMLRYTQDIFMDGKKIIWN